MPPTRRALASLDPEDSAAAVRRLAQLTLRNPHASSPDKARAQKIMDTPIAELVNRSRKQQRHSRATLIDFEAEAARAHAAEVNRIMAEVGAADVEAESLSTEEQAAVRVLAAGGVRINPTPRHRKSSDKILHVSNKVRYVVVDEEMDKVSRPWTPGDDDNYDWRGSRFFSSDS